MILLDSFVLKGTYKGRKSYKALTERIISRQFGTFVCA